MGQFSPGIDMKDPAPESRPAPLKVCHYLDIGR